MIFPEEAGSVWMSDPLSAPRTFEVLQTRQGDDLPQQSEVSVTETMVGLFNHRRRSVEAICLHARTEQTLCYTQRTAHTPPPPNNKAKLTHTAGNVHSIK